MKFRALKLLCINGSAEIQLIAETLDDNVVILDKFWTTQGAEMVLQEDVEITQGEMKQNDPFELGKKVGQAMLSVNRGRVRQAKFLRGLAAGLDDPDLGDG